MVFKLCALMMFKNESDLIEHWIKYHGELLGYENLYIFDNGSDYDEKTVSALSYAKLHGSNVFLEKNTFKDFQSKGDIFSELIKHLDLNNPYDFYFPLDCDEFLSARIGDRFTCDYDEICSVLSTHYNSPNQLKVGFFPTNTPTKPSHFRIVSESEGQRKFFFAKGTCINLDHGFHHGITLTGITEKTNIAYFHFHYRSFDSMQFHSKKKLSGFVNNFELKTIKEFKGSGLHLTQYLLQSEDEYYSQFKRWKLIEIPEIKDIFNSIGLSLPYVN